MLLSRVCDSLHAGHPKPDSGYRLAGFVHRDIRWRNVIKLPAAASSSSRAGADAYVLIDPEHAGAWATQPLLSG